MSGCLVLQALVRTLLVVEVEVCRQPLGRLQSILIAVQVNLLIFDAAPHTLDPDVVQRPTSAIHAYLDILVLEQLGKTWAGELTALICVEHARRSSTQRGLQGLKTEADVE